MVSYSSVKRDNKTYEVGLSHQPFSEYPSDFKEFFVAGKDFKDLMNFNYDEVEAHLGKLEVHNIGKVVRELGLIKLNTWIAVNNDAIRGHKVCSKCIKLEWLQEV